MKKKICLIISVILIVGCMQACGADQSVEPIQWNSLELSELLPEPENLNGVVSVDLPNALSVTLHNATKEQYKKYRDQCIEAGYTIESEDSGTAYIAFNADGYQLRLVLSFEDLYIHLDGPEELSEFQWPTTGLGAMLPATESKLGDISWNNSKTFIVHVGETSLNQYTAYVKACEDIGFTIDFSKDEKYYKAKNADGYELTVWYLGFNIIEISLKAPEENAAPDNNTGNNNTSGEIGKEFKEAMDSYEQFMDKYVAFMKKYLANPSDMSLLNDYANYISQYGEFVANFEKWEGKDLNAAETAYYLEVQARVSKKLLEVAR